MTEYINRVLHMDALHGFPLLPEGVAHACVTSPPYYGLRNYGIPPTKWPAVTFQPNFGLPEITIPEMECCLGMEKDPWAFVGHMVLIFREVKRVLRDDGTLWLNLGDSYASHGRKRTREQATAKSTLSGGLDSQCASLEQPNKVTGGLKRKDLIGIPWMVAFALRSDGWYFRDDIVWAKKNCMPESVTDRPTRSHEFIFLMSKNESYYYDHIAIQEPAIYDIDGTGTAARKARQKEDGKSAPTEERNGMRFKDATKFEGKHSDKQAGHGRRHAGFNERYKNRVYDEDYTAKDRPNGERQAGFKNWDGMSKEEQCTGMRNKRDVWTVAPAQFKEAHFATFPEELIRDPILAGSPEGGLIVDPFMGARTTALVARKNNRNYFGTELSEEYNEIGERRQLQELGMFQ